MILSRSRLPLVLLSVVFAASCAHTDMPAPPPPPPPTPAAHAMVPGGCPPAVTRPEAPIVCVDDTGSVLRAVPDTVYVWDVHPHDKRPVPILWFTATGGGKLQIKPIDEACMDDVWCSPTGGHCRATTRPLEGKGEARCKYDVWIEGGPQPRLDPYVIVQPCCP